ncbi:hypothetical protein BDP27DRAFT_1415020 [Rhodocollybia butyracea]|uniref:Actin cytoskeleton-regulatory complex protein SLA1 n=1 Tax=Rhodocollybia butyracea TaxID=206335 RepID=A0A9P5UF10_9AGAR|nr:hypothetical protein BDP27DRAFT_1415020 [Rhodocollybia butyracea]
MEAEEYLAVLKASYDYEPQSDDEIAIKESQFLFLKERVDEDWWKVKIKGESLEEDTPIGLVPAAYVEQADHVSMVKALYDYEASAPGELSIAEDEILLAFEPEDEWLLVQSTKDGGKAGYVPANYVEPNTEGNEAEEQQPAQAQQIIVPPSPVPSPPPSAPYVDPADRVASTKLNADDIKTWSVSEVDKKGKKMKGTLGIGSGAVFFASETSKAAVQKWPTSSVSNIHVEKSKHVHFDVEGGLSLHFNVGSKDNSEAIVTKLESSKALALQSSDTPPASASSRAPPPPSLSSLPKVVKASVHFAPESPAIIPSTSEPEEEEEPDEEGEMALALYPFVADGEDELSVSEGEQLLVLEKDGDEWWKCRNAEGAEGVVPASYIELASGGQTSASFSAPREEEPEKEDEEDAEDLAAKEAEAEAEVQARAEAEAAAAAAAAERARKEEEVRKEKERKQKEAQARAKAAEATRAERTRTAAITHPSPPPATTSGSRSSSSRDRPSSSSSGPKSENGLPPADRVRVWHDRSGQFRVEAALLNFKEGKLRLHKINGVIVEVPSEKMSVEDMRYVEKLLSKKSRPPANAGISEDDIPLGELRPGSSPGGKSRSPQPKKGPTIDWFDFFLSAGCDVDDCTRYTASFERDKIDEAILPDITESTMRSLGLREGDIIRVKKVIDNRKPKSNNDQIAKDEELARQLQAQENGDSKVTSPPNLFVSGPNGALKGKDIRRGRPQPSKSLPSAVDLDTISEVSDKIQRTESPSLLSPASATPVQPPPRSSSTTPATSGFDDNAWTNRPSSTKPLAPTPPAVSATARAPSAPPAPPPAAATPPNPPSSAPVSGPPSLAKTTEDDVFQQLARLSELRKNAAPAPSPINNVPTMGTPSPIPQALTPPVAPTGYASGMGMGNSPVPMGQHLQPQQTGVYGAGPRGPYAPVPSNQSLLQPLIPTQTGFNGFVPTRAGTNLSPPSFLQSQATGFPGAQPMSQMTGFPGAQPMMSQATGFPGNQPMMSQPTGMPFMNGMNGGMNGMNTVNPFGSGGVMTNPTGFNPGMGQGFNTGMSSTPPVPPLPSFMPNNNGNNASSTNPANVFAQMKSGNFANDNETSSQNANKYDALRPQPTGWGGFEGSYVGYR